MNVNIECLERKALKLDELNNGDVELTIVSMDSGGRVSHGTFEARKTLEKIVIPKHRRCFFANFLIGNETPINETPP